VCQTCQRRLNAVFEDPAHSLLKTMIDSNAVLSLTVRQQAVLSAWFAKTALVLGLRRDYPPQQAWYPEAMRRELVTLMRVGVPTRSVTVRIASVSRDFTSAARTVWPSLAPEPWSKSNRWWTSSVVDVPGLVFEVVWWKQDALARGFIDETYHDNWFVRIWPEPVAHQRWPGRLDLTPLDADQLRAAWKHPQDVVHRPFPGLRFRPGDEDAPDHGGAGSD
jgi:hypothetical protein